MPRADLRLQQLALFLAILLISSTARAGGPRFVTGAPFFSAPQGTPVGWRQANLLYFTDPADLSAYVPHQAADALVAAAAGVWNVPVASLTIAQGGSLAEHVNGQNAYLDAAGQVFPADVTSANAAAIPLAILYDSDGSITDILLGSGASDPSACRQNAVTESVDSFDPAGYILHAILVLNGRCTGPLPQQQLQLQYQLERAFGRVLGLAWSQTNDNVFTGVPTPTYNQALNWPIMHPIDILCGPYSYQCLPNPFQLRADDIASMVAVYPVPQTPTPPAGKQWSYTAASQARGNIAFPTGEGMAGVNVLIRRQPPNSTVPDSWFETSTVSGASFRRNGRSPFVPSDTSALGSEGWQDQSWQGQFLFHYTPTEADYPWQTLIFSLEPINPLYIGQYSLGPYAPGNVAPSGSIALPQSYAVGAQGDIGAAYWTIADAAPACGSGSDGTASAPAQLPTTGWWTGLLCGYGHVSYAGIDVQPNRSLTIEVTALDAQGLATEAKAMPVIGLFAPTDAPGDLPSVGVSPTAFQARGVGTTSLQAKTGELNHLTLGIADQRGDGRPDFAYQARFFYADSVSPAQISTSGGNISISGLGFRAGNAVTINGVSAPVVSWTANLIVVTAPSLAAVSALPNSAVNVTVSDLSTGASSTMIAALTYTAAPLRTLTMKIVSAPPATAYAGDLAAPPFAVQMLAADGITPAAGESVVFTATSGSVRWSACASDPCTIVTGADGIASAALTPLAAGAITLQATDANVSQSVSFKVIAQAASMVLLQAPSGNLPVTVASVTPFLLRVLAPNGQGMGGRSVTFTATVGSATFSGCFAAVCTLTTASDGSVSAFVTPTSLGPITIQAADGDARQTAAFTGVSDQDIMQVLAAPTNGYAGDLAGNFSVRLLHADGTTPDYSEPIVFSAPAGVIFTQCGTFTCTMATVGSGQAQVSVVPQLPGTYTIQAAFGAVTQSIQLTTIPHTLGLQIVSAPTGNLPVGVPAAVPFTVQLLQDGVTPVPNVEVGVNGPQDSVLLNSCGIGLCELITDANGMVSTTITPLKPGVISLSAVFSGISLSAAFTAIGPTETMRIVTRPAAGGVLVGDPVTLTVELIGSDGTTVFPGKTLSFSAVNGSFSFTDCTYGSCSVVTDANGMASMHGVAWGPGPVSIQVVELLTSQTINFMASSKPDLMNLLSAPASGGYAGQPATAPFTVQVFFSDGITPAAGKNITLSVASGAASFAACSGTSTCVLQTNSAGVLSTSVTPLAAGPITISAADGSVTQSASFIVQAAPEVMQVVSVPANGSAVGLPATLPFAVRTLQGDGATPVAGRPVTIAIIAGSATLGSCGLPTCVFTSDANGLASVQITPTSAGSITLRASDGSVSQTATFTAAVQPDQLTVVTVPANGSFAGLVAAIPLSLQVLLADGVTPAANRPITVSVTAGSATLLACGAATCTLTTDAHGIVSSLVKPLAPGIISLLAADASITQSATFQAVNPPDKLLLVTSPGGSVFAGAAASSPFTVRLVLADGVTPVSNASVTFGAGGSSVRFTACPAAPCTLLTDSNGIASIGVTGVSAGTVFLSATPDATTGANTITLPFSVAADVFTVQPLTPAIWLAEASTFRFTFALQAQENNLPSPVQPTIWSAQTGIQLAAAAISTGSNGVASMPVLLGPLAAGVQATSSACAWTSVCANFTATGVALADLRISISSGDTQLTQGSASFSPVVATVVDAAGHPVAGASVSIYQTLTPLNQACPAQGRCPGAPVLDARTTVVISAADGTVSIAPLSAPAVAAQTELAFSAGTQGFVTCTLTSTP